MNELLRNGADAFVQRYHGFRDRLPGNRAQRDAAAEAFALPSMKSEAWRYTSLRPLAESVFSEPLTDISAATPDFSQYPDLPRVVLIDGRYRSDLSTTLDHVAIESFAERPEFGTGPSIAEPMVALNTMLAEDGVHLHVAAGVDAGALLLVSLAPDEYRPVAFHPRHTIRLDAGARLTILEVAHGAGQYLHNAVTEVHVTEGAILTHVRLQDESTGAFHVNTTYAEISGRGTYDAFVLTLGARLARTEIHARLTGPHGMVHLNGAQLLTGNQHGDITTVVQHHAPDCGSRQTIKNVLSGKSRGVFQGKIEVARVAQKTDGYQMNQALLLSPDAEIDCKPQLEIYADDVKCSHGATIGELDADQLFYLRSRGVPAAEARAILVRAFLVEAIDLITHEGARAMLDSAIARWWERQS